MGLQFGGAVGNLADRVRIGWVTDFISIANLPVFNIADLSIFIGTIILVLWVWINERNKENLESSSQEESATDQTVDPLSEETVGE
jgi:signal peptidase II